MRRRGLVAVLFAFLMVGSSAGIAAAATTAPAPVPSTSPPPKCYVMKNNALPVCEENPDGSWSAVYPGGLVVTIAPNDTSGGSGSGTSSGGSNAKRDGGIAVVVAAIIGIGVIAWREWGPKRS